MIPSEFVTREEYQEALLDIAYLKKRVAILESNQESVIGFLKTRFWKYGWKLQVKSFFSPEKPVIFDGLRG